MVTKDVNCPPLAVFSPKILSKNPRDIRYQLYRITGFLQENLTIGRKTGSNDAALTFLGEADTSQ